MTKKKIRFNAVDAVIILFVCAAVAVFGYVFLSEKNVGSAVGTEQVKLQYVLKVGEAKNVFLDNVEKGDKLVDSDANKKLGTVVAVSSTPSKRIGTNSATGAQVISEIEERSDLYVTVEAEAQHMDDKYLVDGISISVGNVINFVAPNLYAASNIISVEILE